MFELSPDGKMKLKDNGTGQSGSFSIESLKFFTNIMSHGIFQGGENGIQSFISPGQINLDKMTDDAGQYGIGLNITTNGNENVNIELYSSSGQTTKITPAAIRTPILNQTSLAKEKKNFERLENALEIISNIDIYKYNLKDEEDTNKKHIGFVIGEDYKYSKELTSNDNDSVDTYSVASCCLQAIKEVNEKVKKLEAKQND